MKVKICGMLTLDACLAAVRAGADVVGFVFAESKRRITPEAAKEIISQLPPHVEKVGVFVNEDRNSIQAIIQQTGITMIQLHGNESPCDCMGYSVPVIKAFGISCKEDFQKISTYETKYILLDSPKAKYHGGNGLTFAWDLIDDSLDRKERLILAGGLTIDNVRSAVEQVRPFMVDVSSGVETNGIKDLQKIETFVRQVKTFERGILG